MNARLLQDLKNTNMKESATKAAPTTSPKAAVLKYQKTTVTLFQTDIKKINAIYSFAATNGRRVTTSDVIKMALRSMSITPELLKILDDIRAADGRVNNMC